MLFSIDKSIVLSLSIEELAIIHSSLNEVCNGIEVFEFETRVGATREEAQELLNALSKALDAFDQEI